MQPRARLSRLILLLGLLAAPVAAQVRFAETFDDPGATGAGTPGPSNLLAQGWDFRVQGGAASAQWRSGDRFSDPWWSYSVPAHLTIDGLPAAGNPAAAWVVLPDVPGMSPGDQVFFALQHWSSSSAERWEVRWSPSGGTGTGSQWDEVGDFTTLVPSVTRRCFANRCWYTATATLPGSGGRLALRYVFDTWFGGSPPMASVDDVMIVQSAPVVLPAPGETVTWAVTGQPYVLLDKVVVPHGGKLVIEAGVEVRFDTSNGLLAIEGDLEVRGTAGAPVRFTLASGASTALTRVSVAYADPNGTLPEEPASAVIDHSDFSVRVSASLGAGVAVTNSTFLQPVDNAARVAGIAGYRSTVRVDDTTITNGELQLNETYLQTDRLTLDNAPLRSFRYDASSPMHLDGLTAVNYGPDSFYGPAPLRLLGSDHFLGPNNSITGNPLPVSLLGGGLLPGSVVPATGNAENFVEFAGGQAWGVINLGDVGVPYVWRYDSNFADLGGVVRVEPGVTIELEPDATIAANFSSILDARGRPDAPITFRRHDPFRAWNGISFGVSGTRPILEHCLVEGAKFGVSASNTVLELQSCLFQNNLVGANSNTFGSVHAGKTRFFWNGEGVQTTKGSQSGTGQGDAQLDGDQNPNWFEGNGIAVNDLGPTAFENARRNYWGDPSGPSHASNPGGQGDSASATVRVLPFRAAAPDMADHPPLVRFEPLYYFLTAGDKVILHWSAEDDRRIVSQRLEYSPHDGQPLSVLLPAVPARSRNVEVVVPAKVPSSNNNPPVFRIVAVDDAGQEGWSEVMFNHDGPGPLTMTVQTNLSAGVVVGQQFPYKFSGVTGDTFILLDDMRSFVRLGWHGYNEGVRQIFNDIPAASTDLARYAVSYGGWYFGPYFSIRPHPVAGDAPPSVSLTSPQAGEAFRGGTSVPVLWTASDDEGLRSFDLQASYDGGISWNFVVRGLPGDARQYRWQLPSSTGIGDVRVRVIARDERFQASSSGTDVAFSILPGELGRSFEAPAPRKRP